MKSWSNHNHVDGETSVIVLSRKLTQCPCISVLILYWLPSVLLRASSPTAVVRFECLSTIAHSAHTCWRLLHAHYGMVLQYSSHSHKVLAGPVLNLSFLMDHVMEKVKPLFWDAVLDSPIPLKVWTFAFPSHILWSWQLLPLHCMYGMPLHCMYCMHLYRMYGMPVYRMYRMQLYRMYGKPLYRM